MKVCAKIKIMLLVLMISIVFPFIFTETLVVAEIEHDCCTTEETQDCIPCLHYLVAINFLNNLKYSVFIPSSLAIISSQIKIPEWHSRSNYYYLSPVELKVRFNT